MKGLPVALWRERTLPQIVDDVARDNPEYVYGYWLVGQDSRSDSIQAHTLTYAQLSNIVSQLAWWLIEQLGNDRRGEVLTYIGPNDVRFTALVLATIKTGFRLFLTSPRNSAIAHRKLFEGLKCKTLITPDPAHQPAEGVLEAVQPCQALAIPSVEELLHPVSELYVMKESLKDSYDDTLFIIHTSGSTGIPKPLNWTQETAVRHVGSGAHDPPKGETSLDSLLHGKRVLSTLPPFHGAGLVQHLLYAIPFGNITVIPPTTGAIVTAHGVVEALKHTPADVAVMVPSIVAELAQNQELLDYCAANLQLILYIGGDLPQAIGDIVASKIQLRCWWGASEVGMPQQLVVPELGMDKGGWHYVRFHPCAGATFEEVSDGLYELVIKRDNERINTQTTFTIANFGNLEEYRTRDLFEPHATVHNAWRWRSRADDIIVFLNGEKTNPVSMEQHITASNSSAISAALVVGAQRFQAALIIEPTGVLDSLTTEEQASLIEHVWPSVDEANKKAPAHARVEKSLILVAPRPFIRAGKGTIQRAATVAQYTAEINKLYADADVSSYLSANVERYGDVTHVDVATQIIRDVARAVTGRPELDEADNFFDSGMDSLQALQLVRTIRTALHQPGLALSTVYRNPTPESLAKPITASDSGNSDDRVLAGQLFNTYRDLVQQFTRDVSSSQEDPFLQGHGGKVDVLLTGSTGTLGTSILHALLRHPSVGQVVCLNRGADGGRATQHDRFRAAQLDTGMLTRCMFLQADLFDPKLGLDEETYAMLSINIGLVIHNAWPVNFNLNLLSFRPLLAGLVNLFKFTASASVTARRFIFVSSVSAVVGEPTETVPDESLALDTPFTNAYAHSKLLAELLCNVAAKHIGLRVSVLRVGQIGGSTAPNGALWNRAEWLPSLVISSALVLDCLPDNIGPSFSEVDWVPSDMLGSVVTDIAFASEATAAGVGAIVFNVRNPRTVAWASLIPSIQEVVNARYSRDTQVVTSEQWLTRLQDSDRGHPADAIKGREVNSNPAVKLVDFYRHGLWTQEQGGTTLQQPMVVSRSVGASDTLRNMPSISPAWMQKWVREWIGDKEE
ncbi:putative NRPS-like enzyme [Xylariaceae sp. FL1019]|nr:putative NRPS-like enzyme [Xylariaceae sp. FL1019]